MTDTLPTLVLSILTAAVIVLVVVLFAIVRSFKDEISSLEQRIDNRALKVDAEINGRDIRQINDSLGRTNASLHALTEHLNVEITEEPQKYVVRTK